MSNFDCFIRHMREEVYPKEMAEQLKKEVKKRKDKENEEVKRKK